MARRRTFRLNLPKLSTFVVALALVALVAACGEDPTPTPTAAPPATSTPAPPASTPEPPAPTPVPPTSTPVPPTSTPIPEVAPPALSMSDLVIDASTTGQDLVDRISAEEAECIRATYGDTVFQVLLATPLIESGTDPAAAGPLFQCLTQENVALVTAAFLAAQAGMEPTGAPVEEEVLTLLYWQAPSLANPYQSAGYKDRDAGAITLEPLAKYSPYGTLVPALAAEIPTIENGGVSQDLMSITWKLREGLKWSDGSEMTAQDAVFTWQYCSDADTGCTAESSFDNISSVEAIDSLTVRITFYAPAPYPYTAFVSTGLPIISRTQFADCLGAAAASCDAQNMAPLGTGPYRLIDFKPNDEAIYERNPYFRGPEPYFDRVALKGGGDAISAARAVMERGEADYAWNLQVDPDTLAEMEAAGRGVVVTAFASLVERIVVNQTNPTAALGDNRSEYLDGQNPHPFLSFTPIPRAMSMAIDRGLIAEELYGFAGEPTCNVIAGPPVYVSTANDGCLTQDIQGAIRLLDDSGVLDTNGDGVREYNGIPLRITYQTSTNAIRQETQSLIRDWWNQIGVQAELIDHDASVFFGGDPVADSESTYRRFFADVQMYATGPDIDPQQYLSDSTCRHIPTRENNWAGGNVARSCNPEYDALYETLAQTAAGPERDGLIKQLNDIHIQSYYEIPLVNRGFVSAYLNSLQGVQVNGWDSELWNIAEWRR